MRAAWPARVVYVVVAAGRDKGVARKLLALARNAPAAARYHGVTATVCYYNLFDCRYRFSATYRKVGMPPGRKFFRSIFTVLAVYCLQNLCLGLEVCKIYTEICSPQTQNPKKIQPPRKQSYPKVGKNKPMHNSSTVNWHSLILMAKFLIVIYIVAGLTTSLLIGLFISSLFNISGDDMTIIGLIILVPFLFMILNTAQNDFYKEQTAKN